MYSYTQIMFNALTPAIQEILFLDTEYQKLTFKDSQGPR